jgi:hypothetical protein
MPAPESSIDKLHRFRTGFTNSMWAGSGDTDTFRCRYCGVAETVRKGEAAKNVRWIAGNKDGVIYACNECAIKN